MRSARAPVPWPMDPVNQGRSTGPWCRGGHGLCGRGPGHRRSGDDGLRHRPVLQRHPEGGLFRGSADHRPRARTDGPQGPSRPWSPRCARRRSPCASDRQGRFSSTTGLVAESGGIIVTPSPGLAGARSITAIEPDGTRQPASVVGVDQTSGLAVLRIDDDLPAATFDDVDLPVGCDCRGRHHQARLEAHPVPSSLVYAGTVVSTGQAVGANADTAAFSVTSVRAPLAYDDVGCPLVAGDGQVIGMLEATRGRGSRPWPCSFPSELVLGVALQLVESGTVDPGWLGIGPATPTSGRRHPTATGVASSSTSDGARSICRRRQSGRVRGAGARGCHHRHRRRPGPFRCRAPIPSLSRASGDRCGGDLRTRRHHPEVSVVLADQDGDAPEAGSSP